MKKFDAIIIGTGQAGPSLSTRLAGAGMKVAVIERKLFGGTCVNTGCIPTKTMVASARAAYMTRRAADFGVMIDGTVTVDMKKVKEQVGDRLCLCGNIDCGLILSGTPEQVYSLTGELLKMCKSDGGFVLGASNALQEEASRENYVAMIKAWQEHGSY